MPEIGRPNVHDHADNAGGGALPASSITQHALDSAQHSGVISTTQHGALAAIVGAHGHDDLDTVVATDHHTAAILESLLTTRGDTIRRSATGPERLALGPNNEVLTSNATDAVWAAAAAGGASIATGTYTGDGTTSQGITGVGFTPVLVWIQERETNDGAPEFTIWTTTVIVDDNPGGGALRDNANPSGWLFEDNTIISLDADGFTVDDDSVDTHPNQNTTVYNFMAIG